MRRKGELQGGAANRAFSQFAALGNFWTPNSGWARRLFNAVNDRRVRRGKRMGNWGAEKGADWSLNEVTKSTRWLLAEPQQNSPSGELSNLGFAAYLMQERRHNWLGMRPNGLTTKLKHLSWTYVWLQTERDSHSRETCANYQKEHTKVHIQTDRQHTLIQRDRRVCTQSPALAHKPLFSTHFSPHYLRSPLRVLRQQTFWPCRHLNRRRSLIGIWALMVGTHSERTAKDKGRQIKATTVRALETPSQRVE